MTQRDLKDVKEKPFAWYYECEGVAHMTRTHPLNYPKSIRLPVRSIKNLRPLYAGSVQSVRKGTPSNDAG